MTYDTYEFALTLPITQGAHQTALEFAHQQPTPAKAERVRLNTLAVLVTQDYLHLMEIPTDLSIGDSWNPIMRLCMDVADLELPGVGRLECRPVLPKVDHCQVPAETWEDRVGYVVVQVDEAASEAQILGFVPTANDEDLLLSELRSPEALLDHLYQLRRVQSAPQASSNVATPRSVAARLLTNLDNWVSTALRGGQQAIEGGWQAVEQVLGTAELSPAYAFRQRGTALRRAKRLTLGNTTIAFVVDIRTESEEQTEIRLQLHPIATDAQLPNGLQMAVLDAADETVIEAEATGSEDFLELQIDGTTGEKFSVQIRLNSSSIVEAFVI